MSKKIIAAALLVLAVTVLFAACKKEEYQVSHTIPVGTSSVEIYEDKDGNEFVTNIDGDMIPVTTDADGFFDSIEDLITETTTKKNKNDKTTTTTTTTTTQKNPSNDGTTTTTQKNPSNDGTTTTTQKNPDNTTTETTTQKQVSIGSGGKQDSISWEEIKNAGKK